jgi:hypothetical protein
MREKEKKTRKKGGGGGAIDGAEQNLSAVEQNLSELDGVVNNDENIAITI